jgi:hypothetical protein
MGVKLVIAPFDFQTKSPQIDRFKDKLTSSELCKLSNFT